MAEQEKEILEEETADAVASKGDEVIEEASENADAKDAGETEAASEEAEEAEAASEEDSKDAADTEDGKKKGLHKKKDKKLEALEAEKKDLEDRVMRQMAEFENYRKRTEKEKSTMFEMGAKSVIEKMLPVVDNFERGLASVPEDKQNDSVYEGMNLVYKQLMTELEKMEVKPIEALGKEFDPNFHNAVMQVESDEFETGFVAQELQKGYTYRDSVVRYSMVAVVQ